MSEKLNNDVVRDSILRVLYKIHTSSKSANSIAKGTKALYKIIREEHDYKESVISHHLDYLVQKGWVAEEISTSTFAKDGISFPQINKKYKISVLGIEKYEEASTFHQIKNSASINITSINSVIVAGNGNIVNASYSELSQQIGQLYSAITESDLKEEQKLNSLADLSTIQNQLSKTKPDKSIIQSAWKGLEYLSTVSGVASLYQLINAAISSFL